MHVPFTTKMQLRSHWLSCYQLPIETYSNCMLPQLDGLKMHVPFTMKMRLRSQWLSCYKDLSIRTCWLETPVSLHSRRGVAVLYAGTAPQVIQLQAVLSYHFRSLVTIALDRGES